MYIGAVANIYLLSLCLWYDLYRITSILWSPEVHYHLHNSPPHILILSQLDAPTSHFLKIYPNIILLSLPGSSKWSLSFRFPHPNSSPMRATCPAHLIFLDLITQNGQYRSFSSSSCSFLHSSVTSSLLGPNILFSTLFLNTVTVFLVVLPSILVWNMK